MSISKSVKRLVAKGRSRKVSEVEFFVNKAKAHIDASDPAKVATNAVDHPPHYNAHPSGVECIQITEHMNFNLGNAIKYVWRQEGKNGVEDLRKAVWYINREIARISK